MYCQICYVDILYILSGTVKKLNIPKNNNKNINIKIDNENCVSLAMNA